MSTIVLDKSLSFILVTGLAVKYDLSHTSISTRGGGRFNDSNSNHDLEPTNPSLFFWGKNLIFNRNSDLGLETQDMVPKFQTQS